MTRRIQILNSTVPQNFVPVFQLHGILVNVRCALSTPSVSSSAPIIRVCSLPAVVGTCEPSLVNKCAGHIATVCIFVKAKYLCRKLVRRIVPSQLVPSLGKVRRAGEQGSAESKKCRFSRCYSCYRMCWL